MNDLFKEITDSIKAGLAIQGMIDCESWKNSMCCDYPMEPDSDICPSCKEHSSPICESCEDYEICININKNK